MPQPLTITGDHTLYLLTSEGGLIDDSCTSQKDSITWHAHACWRDHYDITRDQGLS